MSTRFCLHCGDALPADARWNARFCSPEHRVAARAAARAQSARFCLHCGDALPADAHPNARYCSLEHRRAAQTQSEREARAARGSAR